MTTCQRSSASWCQPRTATRCRSSTAWTCRRRSATWCQGSSVTRFLSSTARRWLDLIARKSLTKCVTLLLARSATVYQVESANVIKRKLGKVDALRLTFLVPPTQPTHAYSCTFAVEECQPYPRQVCDTIYKKHCEKVLPNHIIAIILTLIINTIIAGCTQRAG